MKLIIQRDQADKKNFFGIQNGVQFSLAYKVLWTEKEMKLVRHYRVGEEVLHTTKNDRNIMIKDLMTGQQLLAKDIKILFEMEAIVRGVAQNLLGHLATVFILYNLLSQLFLQFFKNHFYRIGNSK